MRVAVILLFAAAAWAQPRTKPDPNLSAGMAHLERGDFPNAALALAKAETSAGSNPETYVLLATAQLHLERAGDASATCLRGLKAVRGSGRLERYCASLALTALPAAERAVMLEEGVRARPKSPYLQMALGRVLAEADWHDVRAGELLAAAARELPRDPEARYRNADWLCSHEKNEQCVVEIAAALALDPGNLVAQMQGHAFLGNAHDALDHPAEADKAFRRAIETNARLGWPNLRVPMYYARFLGERGREKEAESLLKEALSHSPDCGPLYRELARLYGQTGRPAEAVTTGRIALRYPQGSLEDERALRLILMKALLASGQKDEAEEHQRWVKEHPH